MTLWKRGAEIGSGGFGVVYECTADDRPGTYAMKRLPADALPDARARFTREVRLQSALQHRNVVPIVGMNRSGDTPFFVMPKADYPLVNHFLMEHGESLVWAVVDACSGVAEAHANGIVHRDIKPSNILVFDTPSTKYAAVSDFGLGRSLDGDSMRMTGSSAVLGTYAYMPPEQLSDSHTADCRSDVYSLGIVLYEALTGDVPTHGAPNFDAVPERYRHVVWKACQTDASRRHASAVELLADLEDAQLAPSEQGRPVDRFAAALRDVPDLGAPDPERVDELAAIFVDNLDDTELVMKAAPQMPFNVIQALQHQHPAVMTSLARKFLELTEGPMPFEYCDVIANFCRRLYRAEAPFAIKAAVLERLAWLGWYHNRWHVGDVLADLVHETTDVALIRVLAAVLSDDADIAAWNASYLKQYSLHPILAEALA